MGTASTHYQHSLCFCYSKWKCWWTIATCCCSSIVVSYLWCIACFLATCPICRRSRYHNKIASSTRLVWWVLPCTHCWRCVLVWLSGDSTDCNRCSIFSLSAELKLFDSTNGPKPTRSHSFGWSLNSPSGTSNRSFCWWNPVSLPWGNLGGSVQASSISCHRCLPRRWVFVSGRGGISRLHCPRPTCDSQRFRCDESGELVGALWSMPGQWTMCSLLYILTF